MGSKTSTSSILVGLIVLIGSFLRVFRIGSESLWLDEAYSVHYVKTMNMAEIALKLPWMDNSPPLYYLLLNLWTGPFGYSETNIRALSAVFGIGTIVVIYVLGSELYSRDVGLLSAGLLALSSFHIWYAQEARMYTLLALLASISFLAFWRALDGKRRTEYSLLYVISTVLLGYTHVFGLFVVLSQSMFIVADGVLSERGMDRTAVVYWMEVQALIIILLVPYLRVLLARVVSDRGEVWILLPSLDYLVSTPLSYFGTSSVLQWDPVVYLGLLCLIGVLSIIAVLPLLYRIRGRDPPIGSPSSPDGDGSTQYRSQLLLIFWVLVPIVLPILISYTITPIYVQRYTIPASIGLFILVAKGICSVPRRWTRFVVVILLLVVLIHPLPSFYGSDQREQWQESAQYIEENADSDDLVLLSREDLEYPFEYYFGSQDVTVTAASENTLREEQRTRVAQSETVWVVLSHLNDTEAEELKRSIDRTHRIAVQKEYNDIQVVKFVRE